jgi:hypothetical protein
MLHTTGDNKAQPLIIMNDDPHIGHGIQPAPEPKPPGLGDGVPTAATEIAPGQLWFGVVFGGAVGAVFGALLGGGAVRLAGELDYAWRGFLFGGLAGFPAGAAIAAVERWIRGRFSRPDVATHVGAVLGLLPAVLMLFAAAGAVRGVMTFFLALGLVFVGPMLGMLIGALFDRAVEASQRAAWFTSLKFFLAAILVCGGLAYAISRPPAGPDLKSLTNRVRAVIIHEIRADPGHEDTSVDGFSLNHDGDNRYSGTMEVSLKGRIDRFRVTVTVQDEFFEWKITPLEK